MAADHPLPENDLPPSSTTEGGDDSDEDDEGENGGEDGKSGKTDITRLALDVPEPEQALATDAMLAKGAQDKGKKKLGKKPAVDVAMDDIIAPDEEKPEGEEGEIDPATISAFDRDEITGGDGESVDPLTALLGGFERPWENESLSSTERKILQDGVHRNQKIEKDLVERQERQSAPQRKVSAPARIFRNVAAAVVGVMAVGIKQAQAAMPEKPTVDTIKREVQKPEPVPAQIQEKRNEPVAPVAVRKEVVQKQQAPENDPLAVYDENLKREIEAGKIEDTTMLSAMIGIDALMEVTPYREAMWGEKVEEFKENSREIARVPDALDPQNPAPEPKFQPEYHLFLGPSMA